MFGLDVITRQKQAWHSMKHEVQKSMFGDNNSGF